MLYLTGTVHYYYLLMLYLTKCSLLLFVDVILDQCSLLLFVDVILDSVHYYYLLMLYLK